MVAFVLALPFILYQAWAFIAPGLYAHEKRLGIPLIISSTLLFMLGMAFCYFFVFGQVFSFISSFAPKSITPAPDIEAYLSFVMTMFLAFGIAFEVPVALVVLVKLGVVTVEKLKEWRSYFHRRRLRRRRRGDAAGCRVATGAGDSDVPALRTGHPGVAPGSRGRSRLSGRFFYGARGESSSVSTDRSSFFEPPQAARGQGRPYLVVGERQGRDHRDAVVRRRHFAEVDGTSWSDEMGRRRTGPGARCR
jgi:hypothetical protein